jgi:hypothetical protein
MGLLFTIAAVFASAVILRSQFWGLMTTFYCLRFETPNLEDQVPVFIWPRNRVAQLYPQALGFSLAILSLVRAK